VGYSVWRSWEGKGIEVKEKERLMRVFRHSSNYNTSTRYPNHAAAVNAENREKGKESGYVGVQYGRVVTAPMMDDRW